MSELSCLHGSEGYGGCDDVAKVDIKMPDGFLNKLKNLGQQEDAIAEKVLKAGGEVVLSKAKELFVPKYNEVNECLRRDSCWWE